MGRFSLLTSLSPQRDALIETRTYQWCSVPSVLQLTDRNPGSLLTEGAGTQRNKESRFSPGEERKDPCLFSIRMGNFGVAVSGWDDLNC